MGNLCEDPAWETLQPTEDEHPRHERLLRQTTTSDTSEYSQNTPKVVNYAPKAPA